MSILISLCQFFVDKSLIYVLKVILILTTHGEMDEQQIFTTGGTSRPFCADILVNDKEFTMEIYTGAAVLLITEQTFRNEIGNSS